MELTDEQATRLKAAVDTKEWTQIKKAVEAICEEYGQERYDEGYNDKAAEME